MRDYISMQPWLSYLICTEGSVLFATPSVMSAASKMRAMPWWEMNGSSAANLQLIAEESYINTVYMYDHLYLIFDQILIYYSHASNNIHMHVDTSQ